MARTPEGKVKLAVGRLLDEAGIWYFKPAANGYGKHGIPDFICCADGQFLGIETKAPGKRSELTANQQNRITEIAAAKGQVLVVDDPETLKTWLQAHSYVGRR